MHGPPKMPVIDGNSNVDVGLLASLEEFHLDLVLFRLELNFVVFLFRRNNRDSSWEHDIADQRFTSASRTGRHRSL